MSGTALTNNTAANADTLTLPAGYWLVQCTTQFTPASGTTSNAFWISVTTTSAALGGSFANTSLSEIPSLVGAAIQNLPSPMVPLSLSASTPVYCVVQSTFSGSTMSVGGALLAIRRP